MLTRPSQEKRHGRLEMSTILVSESVDFRPHGAAYFGEAVDIEYMNILEFVATEFVSSVFTNTCFRACGSPQRAAIQTLPHRIAHHGS